MPILTPRLESEFSCLSLDARSQYVYDHFATEEELIMKAFERNGLVVTTSYKKPSGEWIEIPSTNFKVTDKTKKKIKQICDRLSKKWSDFTHSKEYPQWANKFWEENAEKYGMKYSTNMDFSV